MAAQTDYTASEMFSLLNYLKEVADKYEDDIQTYSAGVLPYQPQSKEKIAFATYQTAKSFWEDAHGLPERKEEQYFLGLTEKDFLENGASKGLNKREFLGVRNSTALALNYVRSDVAEGKFDELSAVNEERILARIDQEEPESGIGLTDLETYDPDASNKKQDVSKADIATSLDELNDTFADINAILETGETYED